MLRSMLSPAEAIMPVIAIMFVIQILFLFFIAVHTGDFICDFILYIIIEKTIFNSIPYIVHDKNLHLTLYYSHIQN